MVRRAEEKVIKSSKREESTAVISVTPNTSFRKRAKSSKTLSQVRRSERLRSSVVMPIEKSEIERVIDEITVSESEKEDEDENEDEQPTQEEEEDEVELPETMGTNRIEEKVEYILRRLEAQQRTIDELKSKVETDNSAAIDARYKSLYIKSQRKMEALADENKHLLVNLEIAKSKLEAYEKGTNVFFDVLRKAKDMIIVPDAAAARGAETMSFQPMHDQIDSAENEGRASSPKKAKFG